MSILFFDASVIVKRYIRERGSIWVRQICEAENEDGNQLNRVAIAEISRVEVGAAFAILVRRNEISEKMRDHAYQQFTNEMDNEYRIIRLTGEIIRDAAKLTQEHPLKAYDAVQLATGLALASSLKNANLSLTFVGGDEKLLHAAQAEGLAIENPFMHTDLD